MSKAAQGMIRLTKWQLDEKRRQLADLEIMRDELQGKIRGLENEIAHEKKVISQSHIVDFSYANFAQETIRRRETLEKSIADISVSIEEMKDQVAEAFQELKQYEILEQREQERERHKRERRQQAELDEVSLNIHRRRQA
ncbi:MAG: hypothetical protein CMF31_01135 [Kordiimonas sp.]|nr:hypothetical protein [Kordiimonas sp.]|tara:strand:- start:277 stop:696 length:420 start_codon:yes stop_codon:yes gene_type:complete